jgi:AraC family transcriptional regulator
MFQSTNSTELRIHEVGEAQAIAPKHVEILLVVGGQTLRLGDDVIDQAARSLISRLAAKLLHKYGGRDAGAPPAQGLDTSRLRRVLDYIAANIRDDITLARLAGVAGYSAFHFARKFTTAMGMPPHRYIRRVRLENAMVELATGKLPITEIALNAHFSSQASFTRAFRRVTGTTPKKYQRHRR